MENGSSGEVRWIFGVRELLKLQIGDDRIYEQSPQVCH